MSEMGISISDEFPDNAASTETTLGKTLVYTIQSEVNM